MNISQNWRRRTKLPILSHTMVQSVMEQKLRVFGSLPKQHTCTNGAALRNLRSAYVVPNCVSWTCNGSHTWSAASECVKSKTPIPPIFFPWLIKYGSNSGFFSNSVEYILSSMVFANNLFIISSIFTLI